MRDLTPEELKLAPDWATHYYKGYRDDVLFECKGCSEWLIEGALLGKVLAKDEIHCHSKPLPKKPFDITKHEFDDADIKDAKITVENNYLHFKIRPTELSELIINKQDAIAIAKALGVTGEDLK